MTEHPGFTSVLVANRGEIALRILRSARDMGLRTVAVYTRADADAPHVAFADRAVLIGDGPVGDSYLNIPRLIDAARESGAGAVHPGYGFLSESAEFAGACAKAGLVFVGPPADAITAMGNKAAAKRLMLAAGVTCVPGYQGADQSDARLQAEAAQIGFPVMVKAAAGGGGRGMRLVASPDGLFAALHLARAEAKGAFGSDEIILEKAVQRPRHVEIQVFADRHGNLLHLGERDCSVQRRHQKVVEEAPCPVMTPDLRARMGAAAVEAARAIGYQGAGTVEFLLDAGGEFYFLEMNTRLQVEHPVTEYVTGLDLVALQFDVARGAALPFCQEQVTLTGHAIEVRLYAEDPANGFLPATGDIVVWRPGAGPGIRVDAGIAEGQAVSPHYDPMLAKIIAHGATRDQALQRLLAALRDTVLFGVVSNRDFLIDLLARTGFAAGQATTAFVAEEYGDPVQVGPAPGFADLALAGYAIYRAEQARLAGAAVRMPAALLGWGSPGMLSARLKLDDGTARHLLVARESPQGAVSVHCGADHAVLTGQGQDIRIDGARTDLRAVHYDGQRVHLATGARTVSFTHRRAGTDAAAGPTGGHVSAPMHGNLAEILVREGDLVTPGTRLAVLEAMKMQHEVLAPVGGRIRAVLVSANSQVKAGAVLIEIETGDSEE